MGPRTSFQGASVPNLTVTDTLVLFNDTLVKGNFLAQDGLGPDGLAYDPAKSEIFVANAVSGTVSVVSTLSDRVVATIPGITGANDVAYDPAHGELFVTGVNGLSVINDSSDSVVASTSPFDAISLAYDPGIGAIFVAQQSSRLVGVYNDTNNSLEATVWVGDWAWAFAYDSAKSEMFVATSTGTYSNPPYTGAVRVVADSNLSVVGVVGVGEWPQDLAYLPNRGEVITANYYDENLSVLNDTTDKVVASIPIAEPGKFVMSDPGLSEVLAGGPIVRVISDTSNRVVGNISVSSPPTDIALDPRNHRVWVSQGSNNSLVVINESNRTVLATANLGGFYPDAVAFDSGTNHVFVAEVMSNNVTIVDGTNYRVLANVAVGVEPDGIAYDPSKGEVFVANANCPAGYPTCGGGSVSVISDSNDTVVETIPVGWSPMGVSYDAARGEIFVGCFGNEVYVINDTSDQVVDRILVRGAEGVAYDPAQGEVYVASANSSAVAVINDTTNVAWTNISYAGWPSAVSYDAARSEVFVGGLQYRSGAIAVINDTRHAIVANVTTGIDEHALGADGHGALYAVAGGASNNLSIISDITNTVDANVTVGGDPEAIAVDTQGGRVFVANEANGSLSILAPSGSAVNFPVDFTESGLPPDTSWAVQFDGVWAVSQSTTITFQTPAGTHAFLVSPSATYAPTPAAGSVTVYGAGVAVAIAFRAPASYGVTFVEAGLAPGMLWSVDLGGTTGSSIASTIEFNVSNGTYPFFVNGPLGFGPTPSSGSLRVSGASTSLSVVFTAIPVALSANFSYEIESADCLSDGGVTNHVLLGGQAAGGTGPYTYAWTLPTGNATGELADTTTTLGRNNTVTLSVSDSVGRLATRSAQLRMELPPCVPPARNVSSPTTPLLTFDQWVFVGLGAALTSTAGIAVWLGLRVRRGPRRPG